MEHPQTFEPQGRPLELSCSVEKEDLFDALVLQQRGHGSSKRYFQMALALVLAVGMFYSWLRDRGYTMGLVLAVVCVLLFFALFLAPGFIMRHTAQMLSEQVRKLHFRVYENGVWIHDGMVAVTLPQQQLAVYENTKMYLFETRTQRLYPLPKRAVDPLQRKMLTQLLKGYPVYYVFSEAGGPQKNV